ncbi:MAG: AAA family ATPase [Candidatus Micrarchaeota archaeon]|nr:AAA family ATPase [Candidatus Micrarchaeota archaeon]
MEALILCGMPAAGKTTTAEVLGRRLNVPSIGGGYVLKEMAGARGYKVTGEGWWDTPDGMRFLREREKNPDFDKEADKIMLQKIERGDIVVTSYTMPWLSKAGRKVWLEATQETRAERMARRDSIEMAKAREVVALRDKENYALYKRMYGIELGRDLKPFNIIVDVNNKTPEEAADEIMGAAKRQGR